MVWTVEHSAREPRRPTLNPEDANPPPDETPTAREVLGDMAITIAFFLLLALALHLAIDGFVQ
ncbi:hypothetical protein [Azospirillum sp.]|uniref:hypothetical protein n=1 Tax=Azospirillum sp. TaxID=34012 RepID=UPI002620ABE8|nr:hypothetical protein [Azospirillum sp.]